MSGTTAAATRIEYEPRTEDEELDIDPATGQPIVITRPAPSEVEVIIPAAVTALVSFVVIMIAIGSLIYSDLFFGGNTSFFMPK